jgi:hypothetical protein
VIGERVLKVDGGQLDLSGRDHFSVPSALAKKFGMPLNALNSVVGKLVDDEALRGSDLATSLRTVVIDYRFLEDRWNRLHPAGLALQIKKQGIAALAAGDVDRAWALFESLPRPQAPANLHISGD